MMTSACAIASSCIAIASAVKASSAGSSSASLLIRIAFTPSVTGSPAGQG
jgi:hypothetical protein